jgi:hypothetical protein
MPGRSALVAGHALCVSSQERMRCLVAVWHGDDCGSGTAGSPKLAWAQGRSKERIDVGTRTTSTGCVGARGGLVRPAAELSCLAHMHAQAVLRG